MTLTEARAMCPGLLHADFQPDKDLRGLHKLARWMLRFSPCVWPHAPSAIFVDAGGFERLGGAELLAKKICAATASLQIASCVSVAPTAGAAWAIASILPAKSWRILDDQPLIVALSPLLIESLRIESQTAATLRQVGIETVGQLLKLPRESLPSRFGSTLLMRLDQALGNIPETMIAVQPGIRIEAAMQFEGAIESLEKIWQSFKELIEQIVLQLTRADCGARELLVRFIQPYASPIVEKIILSRPTREAKNLSNLLCCATAHVRGDDGFIGIEVKVPVFERLSNEQIALGGEEIPQNEKSLSQLIDQLRVRLRDRGLMQARLIESYVPERAWTREQPNLNRINLKSAQPPKRPGRLIDQATKKNEPIARAIRRPLHLLNQPAEILVTVSPSEDRQSGRPIAFTHQGTSRRLQFAVGPERIAGQWWDGHNKTRDYFDAEDEIGQRFWIFRVLETFRWYLHGVFE